MNTIKALDILALKSGASKKEVKDRFRQLAKIYHPDTIQDSSQERTNSKFITIKNAYDYLTSLPNDPIIVWEGDLIGPQKRKYSNAIRLPDWIIIKELRNSVALFKLLALKKNAPNLNFKKKKQSNVRSNWNKFIRTIFISILLLILAVVSPLISFSIALSFLLFYPFLWVYNTTVDYSLTVIAKRLGFIPSISNVHFKGGVIYLLTRSLPLIVICLLALWISIYVYKHHSKIAFLGIVSINIYTLILLTSILYEWICFSKIRRTSFTK